MWRHGLAYLALNGIEELVDAAPGRTVPCAYRSEILSGKISDGKREETHVASYAI